MPSPHWGQQARSYFLHPHQHVVDHRSGHSTPNAEAVLAGNIDQFIKAALLQGQARVKD